MAPINQDLFLSSNSYLMFSPPGFGRLEVSSSCVGQATHDHLCDCHSRQYTGGVGVWGLWQELWVASDVDMEVCQ